MVEVMDGAVVRRWCRLAADALGSTRSAIDALNVYPVPDSDTGTNLYRTLRSAAEAVDALGPAADQAVWRAAADGAMLGACGNSGIIVSQLLRGLADICAPASPCDGPVVARALAHAAGLARAAVSRPAEGTVLTVADAAAVAAAVSSTELSAVVLAAGTAARQARDLTTGQLAVLAASGVVDAGAAGLCVVLDAWAAAISGAPLAELDIPVPAAPAPAFAPAAGAGAYEVTYLLRARHVTALREQLDAMGDSLVVAGGPDLWSVHVHVPEAGAAIEAGLRAGQLRRITVTYLGAPAPARHQVLAICATPGLAALAESAGARAIRYDQHIPAAAELSAVIAQQGQRRCIVVPSGPQTRAAAEAAARETGIDVRVVAVQSPVQALPALAVHEPEAEFAADAAAMSRAASRMRFASIRARSDVAAVISELLGPGAELVTLLTGARAARLAELITARVREVSPAAEIECHAGALAGHELLVGVE